MSTKELVSVVLLIATIGVLGMVIGQNRQSQTINFVCPVCPSVDECVSNTDAGTADAKR